MPDSDSERDTVSSQDHLDTSAQLRTLLDRGQAALQEGKRERARRYFEAALTLEKDNEQAWLGLAQLSEDRSLSRAICERLLSINPDFQPARELLATLDAWPMLRDRKASAGPISVPRQPQTQETSPIRAAEESAETQLGQTADENGAALFVPPWEVNTPIPVWGAQTRATSSDQAATHIVESSGNLSPHDHNIELEEQSTPQDARPESSTPIIPDSGPEVPEIIAVISSISRRADDASTMEEAQAITMPTEPNEPTPSLGTPTPAPFTPLAEDADSATSVTGQSKAKDSRLLQNIAMFMMLGFILVGSGLIVFLARNESRAAQLRRMILGVATQSAPPVPTLTQIRMPSPTLIPSPTSMPTSAPSPSPAAAATDDTPTPGASLASDETAERLLQPVEGKWIEVDLSEQVLIAYEGSTIVFKTRISSGRGRTPTVTGQFRIQRKYESQTMTGPGYYLPAVPYVMYFFQGYSLHGTYWHNNWGVPMSHGCINLSKSDAKWLYEWTEPVVPAGSKAAFATSENPGTWVIIHE